jgi:hypothetical protein
VDPLQLEALRFGVAILAGGIVAVISTLLTFRYAERLRRADHEHQQAVFRRALISEIRENLRRLGGPVVADVPGAPMVRVAWDAARVLPFDDDVFDAIAVAYLHGAELERWVEIIMGRMMNKGVVWTWSPENRARKESIAKAVERAQAAYDAFASALTLLSSRPFGSR